MAEENYIDINALPKSLLKEENKRLIKLMLEGDFDARQKLIESNMRLVTYRVSTRFGTVNYDKEELVSIGNLGLIKAIDTFDSKREISLATYAIKCIDNEINMFLRKLKKVQKDISLSQPVNIGQKDTERHIEDFLSDGLDIEEEYINTETILRVRELVKKLPPALRETVNLYYGFNGGKRYTQKEMAKKANCYQSTIQKRLKKAEKLIKRELEKQETHNYLTRASTKVITPPKKAISANQEYTLPKKITRNKTFYELLSDFSKEDVDKVVKGLTEENKNVIMQRYSEGLDSLPTKNLDKEIKKRFYAVLTCVRNKLRTIANGKKTRFKFLYENFPEYSKSQVDKAISVLSDEEMQLLLTRYNGNFNNRPTGKLTTQQKGHFYYVTIPKIKKILISQNDEEAKTQTAMHKNSKPKTQDKSQKASAKEKKIYHGKTFYELLKSYPKEWVDEAFESLSEEEKQIVFDRYNGNLNSHPVTSMNAAMSSKIHQSIIPKIKRAIAVKHSGKNPGKTIYEYFYKYSKDQIDKAIASLSDEEKKIILLRYDGDLNNPASGNLTEAQKGKFYSYIVPKIKNNLIVQDIETQNALPLPRPVKSTTEEVEELTKEDYQKVLELIKNKDFAYIIHGFESKEIMMIILLLGYINSKSYSISTIAKFLEISENEAISAGKSALEKFKQRINQIMDGEDFSTQGAILPTEKDSGDSPFHM